MMDHGARSVLITIHLAMHVSYVILRRFVCADTMIGTQLF